MRHRNAIRILILSLVSALLLFSCASEERRVQSYEESAMIKVLEGDKESLEFSAELMGGDNLVSPPAPGDRYVVVLGESSNARVRVLAYQEESSYIELKFTEKGMATNFNDYIIGGVMLEIRPDENRVKSTGEAQRIE